MHIWWEYSIHHYQGTRSQFCAMTEQVIGVVLVLKFLESLHVCAEDLVRLNIGSCIIAVLTYTTIL